jgi:hypothetical protein
MTPRKSPLVTFVVNPLPALQEASFVEPAALQAWTTAKLPPPPKPPAGNTSIFHVSEFEDTAVTVTDAPDTVQ